MIIAGGNLRFLFNDQPRSQVKGCFGEAVSDINFGITIGYYFDLVEDRREVYHLAFSCYSVSPYTDPCCIMYVSDWVKKKVIAALITRRDPKLLLNARRFHDWMHDLLGFQLIIGTSRGWLFEDLCLSMMRWGDSRQKPFVLELSIWSPGFPGHRERLHVPIPVDLEFKRSPFPDSLPEDIKADWLWASDNASFEGIDAIYCTRGYVFLLQMTVSETHPRCPSGPIIDEMEKWRDNGRKCLFVVLTDTRAHQNSYLNKCNSIFAAEPWQKWHIAITIGLLVSEESGESGITERFPDSIPYSRRPWLSGRQ
jgi:hypothetical protein